VVGVRLADGQVLPARSGLCWLVVISARDTFAQCCDRQGVAIEARRFDRAAESSIPHRWSTRLAGGPSPAIHVLAAAETKLVLSTAPLQMTNRHTSCMLPRGPGGGRRLRSSHVGDHGMSRIHAMSAMPTAASCGLGAQ